MPQTSGAFAALARETAAAIEASGSVTAPLAAALFFLPSLAAGVLLDAGGAPPDSPLRLAALAVGLAISALGQAVLTRIVLGDARRGATVQDHLNSSRADIGAVLLLGLLTGVAVGVGLMALILPGLYLFARFSAALPAMLAERLSPLTAMTRAWELSRGREWPLIGFLGLMLLVMAVVVLTALLVERGLVSATTGTSLAAVGRFTGRVAVGWVAASATAGLVFAQVAAYRWLGRAALLRRG